jgi:hypothetical protein
VLLGHTGAAIAEVRVVGDSLFSADTDERVRVTKLPFGHRIVGNILGHTGSIQQLLPVSVAGAAARHILSIAADASVKVSELESPPFAVASSPLRLEGAVAPVLEFVGGPLKAITAAIGALPSRDQAVAAYSAGEAICIEGSRQRKGTLLRQLKHGTGTGVAAEGAESASSSGAASSASAAAAAAAAASAAASAATPSAAAVEGEEPADNVEPLPLATAAVTSDAGDHLQSVQPVQVLIPRRGIFDGGFVCSSAVQCPASGLVLLALSSPAAAAARAADGPDAVRALRTITGKAIEAKKRAHPGDDSEMTSKAHRRLGRVQVRLPPHVPAELLPGAEHRRFCVLRMQKAPATSSAASSGASGEITLSSQECAIPTETQSSSAPAAVPSRWPQIAVLPDDSFLVDSTAGSLLAYQATSTAGAAGISLAPVGSRATAAAAAINAFLAPLGGEDSRVEQAWSDGNESGSWFWRT